MLKVLEKLRLTKSKIISISGNWHYYFLLIAAIIVTCYNYYFAVLLVFIFIKIRKKLNYKLLISISILILLSFGISKIKLKPKVKNEYIVTITSKLDEKRVVGKSGFKKYAIYLDKNYQIGDKIEISGNFEYLRKKRVPYGFDEKEYYNSLGISGIIKEKDSKKLSYNIFYYPKKLINNYLDTYPNNVKSHLKALIVGEKNFSKDYKETTKTLQISYFLGVSGILIGVLVGILKKVFFYLDIETKRQEKIILSVLFLWLYLSGFKIVLLRYFLIYLIRFISRQKRLKLTRLDQISLAFLIILIINFNYLYTFGFKISFLVITILDLGHKIYQSKNAISRRYIIFLMAYISGLPLILTISNEVYLPVLILAPIFLILYKKILAYPLIFTLIMPFLAGIFSFHIKLVEEALKIMASFNLKIIIPNFSKLLFFGYYLALFLVFFSYNLKSLYKRSAFLLLILGLTYFKVYLNPFSRVYFLDVGQGDTTVVISPFNSKVVVVDAYGDIESVLNSLGIRKIDYLILTHPDNDHIGKAQNILDNITVENVLIEQFDKYPIKTNSNVIKVDYKLRELDFKNLKIEFFTLNKNYYNSNDNSLSFKITVEDLSIMFTGDLSKEVEKDLVAKYQDKLKADFLKLGHHGSNTSSDSLFLKKVNPSDVVISAGLNNFYGFPHEEVLNLVNKLNLKVHRTDKNSTISLYLYKNYYKSLKYYQ